MASIGQPVSVKVKVAVDGKAGNGEVKYTGVRLSAIRPCEKPLIIEQREIFCNGKFEAGEYARTVSIALPAKVVPSSNQRGVRYKVEAFSRMPGDGGDGGSDQEYFDAGEIVLVDDHNKNKNLEVNPVVLAIKGLKLNLQKDIYRPGETIKITFEARDLKELKVLLMERSNILCNCTQYGRVCTLVPKIPPSAAGAAKAGNPTTGFLLLQVPKSAELSTRHEWEPKDRTTWNDKFGDFNEWYLAVTGTKYNGEDINFEIPIEIDEGRTSNEKQEAVPFFETSASAMANQQTIKPVFQVKKIKLAGINRHSDDEIAVTLTNEGSSSFHGCTCKVTGIKDMFFETKPYMAGFAGIEAGASKTIDGIKLAKGVTEVTLDLDANEGKLGTFKSSISGA
jgi:archaellum component FlaF (FlaF/FlaG flagellin family)